MKILWDKYYTLNPIPLCVCLAKAECEKRNGSEKAHQFLVGLNDGFARGKRLLLLSSPLPDIGSIHSLCLQDGNQRKSSGNLNASGSNVVAMVVRVENTNNVNNTANSKPSSFEGKTSGSKGKKT